MTEFPIINTILKCDSWSQPIDTLATYGRWAIQVNFDSLEEAKAFAVEMMMVTSGQPPYDQIEEALALSQAQNSSPIETPHRGSSDVFQKPSG